LGLSSVVAAAARKGDVRRVDLRVMIPKKISTMFSRDVRPPPMA
jgi:predicted nucleotidyltransferase